MTVVAIHQPNFLPYPGFFYKMHRADVFVLYDTAQYSKNEYHNRNRIKTPRGPLWLTVPVRSRGFRSIKDVEVDNSKPWAERLWRTIEVNYARAPHFDEFRADLQKVFGGGPWNRLVELNLRLIEFVRAVLGIKTPLVHASNLPVSASQDPTEKLIMMVQSLGGNSYLSGPGGADYLDRRRFGDIALEVAEPPTPVYPQLWGSFVPSLSVLDAILNCGLQTRELFLGAGTS